MNTKRDKIAIMQSMLQIVANKSGRIKPTEIMYKANLSHEMLKVYMNELLSKEFIIEQVDKKGKRTYTVTIKGYTFLKDYEVIKKFFDSYHLN
ncbi:MAG: winged helix-turn-helix domain-containing protein [Candidatus Nanoarchaeia archaeon]